MALTNGDGIRFVRDWSERHEGADRKSRQYPAYMPNVRTEGATLEMRLEYETSVTDRETCVLARAPVPTATGLELITTAARAAGTFDPGPSRSDSLTFNGIEGREKIDPEPLDDAGDEIGRLSEHPDCLTISHRFSRRWHPYLR